MHKILKNTTTTTTTTTTTNNNNNNRELRPWIAHQSSGSWGKEVFQKYKSISQTPTSIWDIIQIKTKTN